MTYNMMLYRGRGTDTTSSRITEANATTADRIIFNTYGADYLEGASSSIINFTPSASRHASPTGNVGTNAPEIQDTGFKGRRLTIKIKFENYHNTLQNRDMGKLDTWASQDQEIADVYPTGRFGFWCRRPTAFNRRPTGRQGFYIDSFTPYPEFEYQAMIPADLVLKLGERPA